MVSPTVSSSPGGTLKNGGRAISFRPHGLIDSSGFSVVGPALPPWKPDASLEKIGEIWNRGGLQADSKVGQEPSTRPEVAENAAKSQTF